MAIPAASPAPRLQPPWTAARRDEAGPSLSGIRVVAIDDEDDARIRATRYERIMIVEVSARRAIDFAKSTDPLRFTNHSCQANARLAIIAGRIEFYSLRAIEPGEEITVNYGETHHEGQLRCRCGAPNCVGRL